MRIFPGFLLGALLLIGIAAVTGSYCCFPLAVAQEAEKEEFFDDEAELAEKAEELEQRLNELEELIEQAERRGDEELVRRLRGEGERLLDALEEIERLREGEEEEEEWEEWEEHAHDLEIERLHLELERIHVELHVVRQEEALRMASIASDKLASASYAILQATELMEVEAAIEFLEQAYRDSQSEPARKVIQHQLARLYQLADRPDASAEVLRDLILDD